MKLILIRHGEPDYEHDTLTEKGWQEASFLALRMASVPMDEIYVSPLGRARDTASLTLERLDRTAVTLDWLREFAPKVRRPHDLEKPSIAWDWLPQDWMTNPLFYDKDHWFEHPLFEEAGVREEYYRVIGEFDHFLEEHGYCRCSDNSGALYRVTAANNDTIVFFCHLGLGCLLMSRLLDISPMILWHGFCPAPASVTEINTEERRPGLASFRISRMGDISHLYAAGEEPSFHARFRECYTNENERRD